jgi:hypothetical protein
MRNVYAKYGVAVIVQSIERLALSARFWDIDNPMDSTDEFENLYENNTNFVRENDAVVYFVASIVGGAYGFTLYPDPATIISLAANVWVMAHEVGHALDLNHPEEQQDENYPYCPTCRDPPRRDLCMLDRLMTCCGTNTINVPSPVLADSEVKIMKNSDLIKGI